VSNLENEIAQAVVNKLRVVRERRPSNGVWLIVDVLRYEPISCGTYVYPQTLSETIVGVSQHTPGDQGFIMAKDEWLAWNFQYSPYERQAQFQQRYGYTVYNSYASDAYWTPRLYDQLSPSAINELTKNDDVRRAIASYAVDHHILERV
jgi:hypothetical protein